MTSRTKAAKTVNRLRTGLGNIKKYPQQAKDADPIADRHLFNSLNPHFVGARWNRYPNEVRI